MATITDTAYVQQTCEGCLAVDLLRMANLPSTLDEEIQILSTGFALFKSSYAVAICLGFALRHKKHIVVTVESPQFAKQLQKDIKGVRGSDLVKIKQGTVNTTVLQGTPLPYILYVDSHAFSGTYEHSPHFICVEDRPDKDAAVVLDPMTGKVKEHTIRSLMAAARSLRSVVRFSPLIIQLKED